jgi:putative FmdB family regulatory protein
MPIYEYKCRKCGHRFEMRRSFSDKDSDIECPVCAAQSPEKVLSTFSSLSSNTASTSCALSEG